MGFNCSDIEVDGDIHHFYCWGVEVDDVEIDYLDCWGVLVVGNAYTSFKVYDNSDI